LATASGRDGQIEKTYEPRMNACMLQSHAMQAMLVGASTRRQDAAYLDGYTVQPLPPRIPTRIALVSQSDLLPTDLSSVHPSLLYGSQVNAARCAKAPVPRRVCPSWIDKNL